MAAGCSLASPAQAQAPRLTSPGFATGTVGQPFTFQITATGTVGAYGATGLPPGLALNPNGLIGGTPSASGQFNGTLSVNNALGGNTHSFAVNIQPPAPTPGTWQTQDVGAVAAVGSASEAGGIVTLRGSGADIWERADEFRFRYQAWSGDGEIVARVTGQDNTSGWAKAGVMWRESLAAGSSHAFMCLSPANGAAFQRRSTTGALTSSDGGPWVTAPYWVKLTRNGSTFTGYVSSDGVTWTQVASTVMALPATTYVGLAVTSHNDGTLCTGTFEQVALRPPGSWSLAAPSGLTATALSPTEISLAWTDNSTTEAGFELEGSTDNALFHAMTTVGANVTSHTVSGFTAGTTYYFRVRAVAATGSSAYSTPASVRTPGSALVAAPSGLVATDISDTQARLNWTDHANNEDGFEIYVSDDNVSFTYGGNAPANALTYPVTGLRPASRYYFRVRAWSTSTVSDFSGTISLTTLGGAPSSSGLTRLDVGAVAAAGSYSEAGGVHTLSGSGEDIWDTRDEFSFAYVNWTGDGALTARVTGLQNTDSWAKAGLMVREGSAPEARNVMVLLTPQGSAALQARPTPGGTTGFTPAPHAYPAMWLRLTRTGTHYVAAQSPDGASWTTIGSVTLNSTGNLLAGLAVTSHRDGTLCTATFDQVSLTGGGPTDAPPAAPSGLTATAGSAAQIDIRWTDNSADEVGFRLERSTDGVNFSFVSQAGANATSYTDPGLTTGTLYHYRIQAVRASGSLSAFSNTASASPSTTGPSSPVWQHVDVGAVGIAGSDDAAGATITLRGSGPDIWDNADGFRFLYQALRGDCQIEAQVTSLTHTNGWAKAGVMIRESLAPNARNIFICLTPSNGLGLQIRSTTGGNTSFTPGPWGASMPYWIRLVRTGNNVVASISTDGVAWSPLSSVSLALAADVYVGFAVTSHDNSALTTATFADPWVR